MFQRDMNSEAEYAAHMISWLPHGAAHLAAKGGKTSWLATTSVCRLLSRARVFASTSICSMPLCLLLSLVRSNVDVAQLSNPIFGIPALSDASSSNLSQCCSLASLQLRHLLVRDFDVCLQLLVLQMVSPSLLKSEPSYLTVYRWRNNVNVRAFVGDHAFLPSEAMSENGSDVKVGPFAAKPFITRAFLKTPTRPHSRVSFGKVSNSVSKFQAMLLCASDLPETNTVRPAAP